MLVTICTGHNTTAINIYINYRFPLTILTYPEVKTSNVFVRSNTVTIGSYPSRGSDANIYSVFVLLV